MYGHFGQVCFIMKFKKYQDTIDIIFNKKKTFYIFRYTVSAETGYVAEVSYEGTPVYPKVKKA